MKTIGPKRRGGGYGDKRPGRVYYILAERGGQAAIKIGISDSVMRRTHHFGGILLACHEGSGQTEIDMHKRFLRDALGEEWFRPSPELLLHICRIPRRSKTQVEADDQGRASSPW